MTLATNFGIMGLTVVTGSVNARVLGPTGRGELAAIQTIPSALGMFALLGLPSAVGYFSARRPAEVRAFTATAVAIFFIAVLPLMVSGFFWLPMALHFGQFPYLALQGLGRFGIWNLLRPVPNLVGIVAMLVAYGTGAPSAGSFARWYLFLHALTIPFVFLVLWVNSKPGGEVTVARAKELLRFGLPSAVMVPAGLLNLQLDQMLMAAWLPSAELGLYVIGVSWSGLLAPVFGAFGSVVFPTLAAVHDRATQRVVVARAFRRAVLLVIILGAGLAAVTPFILPLLFGRSFKAVIPSALVLVGAAVILNLGNLSGEVLRGLGVPRWPLYSQFAALPVTVILLVVLLPRWSVLGAALSSVFSYAVVLAVSVSGIRQTIGLTLREMLVPRREDAASLWLFGRGVLSSFVR